MKSNKPQTSRYKVFTRTLTLKGGSYTVAIPGEVIDYLGLSSGQELAIVIDRKSNVVMIGDREKFGLQLAATKLENGAAEFDGLKSPFTEEYLLDLLTEARGNAEPNEHH